MANTQRERDARDWIKRTLEATNAFDAIYAGAFAKADGHSSGDHLAASIEPVDATNSDPWSGDGAIADFVDVRLRITFYARARDGLDCDDAAERLYNLAYNALTGSNLGGLAMPAFSKFSRPAWKDAKAPERRIEATFSYRYLVDDGMNVDS